MRLVRWKCSPPQRNLRHCWVMRALLALLAVADALQAGAPGAVRTRLPALSVRAQAPVELAEGEWGSAPIAAAGPESAEGLMQRVLEWLPDMLVNLEVEVALTDEPTDVEAHATKTEGAAEEDPDPEDLEFVAVGRPWLHTAAFHLATGATPAELGAAVWAEAEGAAFLRQDGGGGGLRGRCKSAAGRGDDRAPIVHLACLRGWGVPTFPEALLRPPRSLRGAVAPQAALRPPVLPLCFHPVLTLCPTGCSCSCRSSRPTSRSSSRSAPPSPPPRGKPTGSYERPAPGPRPPPSTLSASAPAPPSAPFGWHAWRLRLWSLWARPSTSPRSQARDQRRATSTGVPPQRQDGGAALPRGALPVLHRLARSVRGRKPGGRFQVMPTCGNLGSLESPQDAGVRASCVASAPPPLAWYGCSNRVYSPNRSCVRKLFRDSPRSLRRFRRVSGRSPRRYS